MKKVLLFVAAFGISGSLAAIAQEKAQTSDDTPTVVFGSAATADGNQNMFLVEQPKDAPNPLGNPLDVRPEASPENMPKQNNCPPCANSSDAQPNKTTPPLPVQSNNPAVNAEELGKDFQNTLLEANGRVYDVQSFPEQDLNVMGNPADPQTIYSPNVNN